jgi:Glycosyl transferase family 2
MRALAILTVKNEAAFLLDWLAYHRTLGFTDILVLSNDCTDGTDQMLDRAQAMGLLTHLRNDGPHDDSPQWSALKRADKHPALAAADWALFFDIDEYVNIHVGARRLPDLIAALPADTTALTLTWRLFGNAGVIPFRDQPLREQFTRAAPATLSWPWRAQMFKTLFRPSGAYRKLGVHRPKSPDPAKLASEVWRDGSGRPIEPGQRLFSNYTQDNYGLAQLNHYALGSLESYLLKCDRGRANREASAFDMSYFVERNLNQVEDRSILSLDIAPALAELHADPQLSSLHKAGVAWRQARFASLMQDEVWRSLYGRLLMVGPSRALGPAEAALIHAHRRP